jgi:hypothetical protein
MLEQLELEEETRDAKTEIRRIDIEDRRFANVRADQPFRRFYRGAVN